MVLAAQPSAFNPSAGDYDHSLPADLMASKFGKSPSPYLNNDSGLIDVYTYYDVPNPAADPSQPSDAGLPNETAAAEGGDELGYAIGSADGPTLLTSTAYTCDSEDDPTYYESQLTVYARTDGSDNRVTKYNYSYDENGVKTEITTLPAASTSQGGTDTSTGPTSSDVYNTLGQACLVDGRQPIDQLHGLRRGHGRG